MSIGKIAIFFRFFLGIGLILCSVLSAYKIFSYIAIIIFIAFLITLLFHKRGFFIKYLAFIFVAIAAIFGVAVIELFPSFYMNELRVSSHFAGSLPLIAFSYWLLLEVFYVWDATHRVEIRQNLFKKDKRISKVADRVSFIVLILFTVLFSRVATNPAILLGMDRFMYASQYSVSGILAAVINITPLLLVFPILSVIHGKKSIGLLAILMYILYFLWIGNKFGPFFTLICVFLLIYYKEIIKKGTAYLRKIIIIAAIAFGIVVLLAIFFSVSTSSYNPLTYFQQRAAQQGQLWWKTYEKLDGESHPEEFSDEIKALGNGKESVTDNIGSSNGIYKIMYFCAPRSVVDYKLSTGSRYTEAGFASMYYYFGIFGVIIFAIICGIVFSSTLNSFIKALNNTDYIKALILLRLFMFERTFITMFTFNDFLDVISILSYIYLILMHNKKLFFKTQKGRIGLVIKSY